MRNYLVLVAIMLVSGGASAETWRCTDLTTYRSYIVSQNVPADRCVKTSDSNPTDLERMAAAPTDADLARQEKREAKEAEDRQRETADELAAAEHSSVTCKNKLACGKAFALAQIYIQQNADQKIQVATDTIIDTYNPTEGGKVGITVTKIPRAGTTEVISIEPHCKLEGIYYESVCRLKRTAIYRGFRPFIEKSLSM